jgi:hypothetical protein
MSFFPEYTAVVSLTAAQIKTLHTTPVVVAPGKTGCIIDVKSMVIVYHYGGTPFNPGSSDAVCFITGTLPNAFVGYAGDTIQAEGFCDQATDQIVQSPSWWVVGSNAASIPLSDVIGSGISIWQYAALSTGWPTGANWTTGNGTFTVYVTYSYIVA